MGRRPPPTGDEEVRRVVELSPEAEREVGDAFVYYERSRRGLGTEFLRGLELLLEGVRQNPLRFARVQGQTRRAGLRRFPYFVLYVLRTDRIVITGLFHDRRSPARWVDRIQERAKDVYAPTGATG